MPHNLLDQRSKIRVVAQAVGDKRTLSEKLRVALNKAAHYHALIREEPLSDFLTKAHRLITDI